MYTNRRHKKCDLFQNGSGRTWRAADWCRTVVPEPRDSRVRPGTTMTLQALQLEQNHIQLHWYLCYIIEELPQLIDTLTTCLELLSNPDSIKLAITSKLDWLHGIVTRDGPFIKNMNLHMHHFKVPNLQLNQPFELTQIKHCQLCVINSIEKLSQFITLHQRLHQLPAPEFTDLAPNGVPTSLVPEVMDETIDEQNHAKLFALFKKLQENILEAKRLLQLPTDTQLIFPQHVPSYNNFIPPLSSEYSLDIYINQANLCIDFKRLHIIKDEPWCQVKNGKSFVDKVKDDLKIGNLNVNDLQDMSSLALKYPDIEVGSFSWFKKFKPIDYVTKCITFNGMVTMIDKKVEVSLPDPILMSVLTKLDSLAYLINSYLTNLEMLITYNTTDNKHDTPNNF